MRSAAGIALLVGTSCTLRFDAVPGDAGMNDGGTGDGATCPSEHGIPIADLVDFTFAPIAGGFAMVWSTWDGVGAITDSSFARYDWNGARVGDATPLATSPAGIMLLPGGLVATDAGFGLLWQEQTNYGVLHLARLDETGAPVAADLTLPGAEAHACCGSSIWRGDGYQVVWRYDDQTMSDLVALRLDAEGASLGTDMIGMEPDEVSAANLGGEVGVAVIDETLAPRIVFLRLDAAGNALGPAMDLATDRVAPSDVRVAASETAADAGYGVVWVEGPVSSDRQVFFAAVDVGGSPLGPPVPVTERSSILGPALAWIDGRFVVAWSDGRHGNDEVYVRALDAAGAPLGAELRVTTTPTPSWAWKVMPAGDRAAVIWTEENQLRLSVLCPL